MKIRLIERGDEVEQPRDIAITSDAFLIGRGADCDLRLNDSTISRHHCIIRKLADDVMLVDLGSINGSFLNGKRILSTAPLKSGDELTLGSNKFVLALGEDDFAELNSFLGENPLATTLKLQDRPQKGLV